jgi:hypothetical protein
MSVPRWKIDDTTFPGRILCEHTQYPRLIGELLPYDETPEESDALAAPGERCLGKIRWLEDVEEGIHFEVRDMYDSLAAALEAHQAAKAQTPSRIVG